MKAAILTDITKCIGCNQCVEACVRIHHLGKDIPEPQDTGDGLSATRWTSVIPRPDGHFVRKQCRHCLSPSCVSVCPVGALQKTPEGPVIYDKSKCIGCRYCIMACPFEIPHYQWGSPVPYVQKCTMCYERLAQGKQPACTEACPTGATIFGERDALLVKAKERLDANPKKYIQRIYGQYEVGGTSVLYISDIPIDFLGWQKELGDKPLPELTWRVINKIPSVVLGAGFLLTGLYWIIDRRTKINQNNTPPKSDKNRKQQPEDGLDDTTWKEKK